MYLFYRVDFQKPLEHSLRAQSKCYGCQKDAPNVALDAHKKLGTCGVQSRRYRKFCPLNFERQHHINFAKKDSMCTRRLVFFLRNQSCQYNQIQAALFQEFDPR